MEEWSAPCMTHPHEPPWCGYDEHVVPQKLVKGNGLHFPNVYENSQSRSQEKIQSNLQRCGFCNLARVTQFTRPFIQIKLPAFAYSLGSPLPAFCIYIYCNFPI